MESVNFTVMTILGPLILLAVLVFAVTRRRSSGRARDTEQATRDLYRDEDSRRRDGSDGEER